MFDVPFSVLFGVPCDVPFPLLTFPVLPPFTLMNFVHSPYSSSLGHDYTCFVGYCFSCGCCSTNALGNAVRVYPETVQGLTFYRSKDN